jgi:feruloyl esterase
VLTRDKESRSGQPSSGAPLEPIDNSFRLFMVPGMAHCGGGPGATHFDALAAVVNWVENGIAPDKILASKLPPSESSGAPTLQRPLCPYPRVAQYQGSGSVNDASSFVCTDPNPMVK